MTFKIDKKIYPKAMAPNMGVVELLVWKSRFLSRIRENEAIRERKEQGFISALQGVDRSSEPFDDSNPLQFGDLKYRCSHL